MYNEAVIFIFVMLILTVCVLVALVKYYRNMVEESDTERIILMERIQELKDYIKAHGIV